MASKQHDEEFELVLGNKQLLSLFFVAVVFFAGFFITGYTVGYSHGEDAQATPTMARLDPVEKPADEVPLPAALLKDPPVTPPKPVTATAAEKPSPKVERPAPAAAAPAVERPSPKVEKPKPPAPKPAAAPAASPEGSLYVQVAALTLAKDAEMLVGKLKELGYPAASRRLPGEKLVRVGVGPASDKAAAERYRARLKKDGFETFIRTF